MIKIFCDHCKEEIVDATRVTPGNLGATPVIVKISDADSKVAVELQVVQTNKKQEGDICLNCVAEELVKMKTRATFPTKEVSK